MAVIVDEFGGTAGVVSAEELTGELVGLVDLSRGHKAFETIDERTFQINGGLRIDDANALGLGLPTGPYETVAGFVLSILGHIPREGEQLEYNGLKMVITKMNGVRISKITATKD
jgi:CBS domain containing-hemolysin-like protein